jgi:hypothetical protein
MRLAVPTIMCEAIAVEAIEFAGKTIKPGEIFSLPYGVALQLRALGQVGGLKDEDDKHAEASEALAIYGGDSWFPHSMQTISRVSDYLAQVGTQTDTVN